MENEQLLILNNLLVKKVKKIKKLKKLKKKIEKRKTSKITLPCGRIVYAVNENENYHVKFVNGWDETFYISSPEDKFLRTEKATSIKEYPTFEKALAEAFKLLADN
jgi:hypothetical protein